MKRFRGFLIFILIIALCIGGIRLLLHLTAEYPTPDEAVNYDVNQVDGFTLTIEEPSFSLFRGYTLRYKATADSDEIFYFLQEDSDFEYLERCINGQWYRFSSSAEHGYSHLEFALGGETSSSLQACRAVLYKNTPAMAHGWSRELIVWCLRCTPSTVPPVTLRRNLPSNKPATKFA